MAAFDDGAHRLLLGDGDLIDRFGDAGDVMALVGSPDSSIALNSLDSWLSSPGNEGALEELLFAPASNAACPTDFQRSSGSFSSHSSDSGNHSPSSTGGGLGYDVHATHAGVDGNWQSAQMAAAPQYPHSIAVASSWEAQQIAQGAGATFPLYHPHQSYHPYHDSYSVGIIAAATPTSPSRSSLTPSLRPIRPATKRKSESPSAPQCPVQFGVNRGQVGHLHVQKRDKEDRRIRNRAAAQTSREKKRVEQDQLRSERTALATKCSRLEHENNQLSSRLDAAEKANARLIADACTECRLKFTATGGAGSNSGGGRGTNVKRAGLCLLALIGTFTLNWPNETGRQPREIKPLPGRMAAGGVSNATDARGGLLPYGGRNGRSLTFANESAVVARRRNATEFRLFPGSPPLHERGVNASKGVRCPHGGEWKLQMNATESLRLNNDLWSWMDRHEKMNELRRAGYLLYPSRSMLPSHGYYDAGDIGDAFNANYYYSGDSPHPKWPLGGGRRRTTWEKKESARLKAVRDRAWRHLRMITPSQPQNPQPSLQKAESNAVETNSSSSNNVSGNGNTSDTRPHNDSAPAEKLVQLITSIQQALAKTPAGDESMLYLVALQDYFLLPSLTPRFNASMHPESWLNSTAYSSGGNSTSVLPPPRLTLILPALSTTMNGDSARGGGGGGGPGQQQPSLMRIQCEVIGTGLIHLPEGGDVVVAPTLFDTQRTQLQ